MAVAPPILDKDQLPFGGMMEPPEGQEAPPPEMGTPELPGSVMGSEVPPGQPIPAGKMHQAEHLAANPQAEANFRGKQDFHETMRGFEQRDAANRGSMLALDPSDPDYLKKLGAHQAQEGMLKSEQAHFQKMHPWGAQESAHPGVLGKIGHVASEIGQVAGSAVVPNLMKDIPGTEANLGAKAAGGQAEENQGAGLEEKAAQTGEQEALASEAPSKIKLNEAQAAATGNKQPTNDFELWRSQNPQAPVSKWFELQNQFKPEKPDTATQNKQAFQDVLGKIDAAGIPVNPTDYAKVRSALDSALGRKLITPEEHSTAIGYMGANPTPGTSFTINTGEKAAGEGIKEGSQFYAVNGKFVRGRDLTPEQRANSVPVKDVEKAAESVQSTNSTIKTFQRYKQALDTANLSPDDVKALQVLTAPQAVAHSYLDKEVGGVLDSLFGEPLTGYSEKAMGGIMTKDQYDKLSPAGQKALVGYYNALIANFADMKKRLGGIGRNESMIQAEIHTIPLPYIKREAADEAFNQKLTDIESRNIYMGGGNTENPPAAAATDGGEFKVPEGAPAPPKEDGHYLKVDGKRAAISKGGQWAPLP